MKQGQLFGPVPSRRLGISLGIDMLPHKTCTLNCVYCECGFTDKLTTHRGQYVPTAEIIAELDDFLKESPQLDYITFSGSGEPTLHSGMGEILDFLKEEYSDYNVAVLTNATLFGEKEVIRDISNADLILPSLDAASKQVFQKINRPHKDISFEAMIKGLSFIRQHYFGKIWLEVFIVPGLNDCEEELAQMKEIINRIRPEKVQINTLDRPGTERWVMPAGKEELKRIASYLGGEIIADFRSRREIGSFSKDVENDIIATIRRRPCTEEDLSSLSGLHLNEVNKYLQVLLESGKIEEVDERRGRFFRLKR